MIQLQQVTIDPEGTGSTELIFTIPAAQQTYAQYPCAAGCQKVPHRISNHVAIFDSDSQALLAGEKKIRFGFGAHHITAFNHHYSFVYSQGIERRIDFWPASGCGDTKHNLIGAKKLQEFYRPWQWTPFWEKLCK